MEKKSSGPGKDMSTEKPLIHNFNNSTNKSIFTQKLLIFLIISIVLGGVTGYALSAIKGGGGGNTPTSGFIDSSKVSKGTVVGSGDTKTFKDTASGTLKNGGINGEGQFHLVRPGGDSQNVYLTSSTLDLSGFIGKKIKVWGETQKAQYAGWLMDVGKVEVTE